MMADVPGSHHGVGMWVRRVLLLPMDTELLILVAATSGCISASCWVMLHPGLGEHQGSGTHGTLGGPLTPQIAPTGQQLTQHHGLPTSPALCHASWWAPQGTGINSQAPGTDPRAQGSIPRAHGSIPRAQGSIPMAQGLIPKAQRVILRDHGSIPKDQGSIPRAQGARTAQN